MNNSFKWFTGVFFCKSTFTLFGNQAIEMYLHCYLRIHVNKEKTAEN